ncbi:hypothetical protein GCM10020218_005000 [Dactylosporangium vinaceum]
MAKEMSAPAEWNPNAIRVISRILVFVDSIRPLDRPVGDGGQDRRTVSGDAALQGDERRDPAAAGPAGPRVQGYHGVVRTDLGDLEHCP